MYKTNNPAAIPRHIPMKTKTPSTKLKTPTTDRRRAGKIVYRGSPDPLAQFRRRTPKSKATTRLMKGVEQLTAKVMQLFDTKVSSDEGTKCRDDRVIAIIWASGRVEFVEVVPKGAIALVAGPKAYLEDLIVGIYTQLPRQEGEVLRAFVPKDGDWQYNERQLLDLATHLKADCEKHEALAVKAAMRYDRGAVFGSTDDHVVIRCYNGGGGYTVLKPKDGTYVATRMNSGDLMDYYPRRARANLAVEVLSRLDVKNQL